MRWAIGWALALATSLALPAFAAVSAAEYYYRQHDYRQALPLWKEIARREPDNAQALIRVAELSLWTEGRAGLPELFRAALEDPRRRLPRETRAAVKSRYRQLQSVFVSDQAQNLVLQGQHRASRGDWKGALEVYQQAALLDRGNLGILRERARAEKALGLWSEYLESLSQSLKSYPYDTALLREFAEASLYFRNYDAVNALYRAWEGPLEPADRVLWGVALADSSHPAQALPLLRAVLATEKPPAVAYQALAAVTPNADEARRLRVRFVDLATRQLPEPSAWDPFRLPDRLNDARRELTRVP